MPLPPLAPHPAPAAFPAPLADLDQALTGLAGRYGVAAAGSIGRDATGWFLHRAGERLPLLPWRHERRFIELRRLVEGRTLEHVAMLRFAAHADPQRRSLRELLARELDLCAFITGSVPTAVHAVCHGDRVANAIVSLAGGVKASLECSTLLPLGSRTLDRHEIIARRGVASDRVVDTQVPQSSVYLFAADGVRSFTDTDAELYGLDEEDAAVVRAAFALLAEAPGTVDGQEIRRRLDCQIDAIFQSHAANTCVPL